MQNGFYSATGAMVTQFNRLDVIANNLANVNTTGFKRDDVVIGDFERIFQDKRDELPLRNHTKEAAKFLNRSIDRVPQVVEEYTVFKQGGVKKTSNPLDFSLKRDDIFFMVETPNGVRLTQDGSFQINEKGILTTKEGYPILPESYLSNGGYIEIPSKGSLHADEEGNLYVNGQKIAKFFIAQVENMKKLQKEGENLFKVENMNEEIREMEKGNYVAQGFLETSNVNPVIEMTSLIETNRLVEMYQKVMNSHMDDLNNEAINKLASVRA